MNCDGLVSASSDAAKVIMQSALQSTIRALSSQQSPYPAVGLDDVAQSGPMFGLANAIGRAPKIRATTNSDARILRKPLALLIDRAKAKSIQGVTRLNAGSLPATRLHYPSVWEFNQS